MKNNLNNSLEEPRPSGKEIVLLNLLRQNARAKLNSMSSRARMPLATVHKIVKRLSATADIIKRYSSILDFPELGFSIGCFYIAKPYNDGKKQNMESLISIISRNKNVNSISATTEDDVIIEAWFRSMAEVVDFRDVLSEFSSVEEHEIIESLEQERFVIG